MAENHEVVEIGDTSCNCSASPSSSVYHSPRIEGLLQSQTDYVTALDFEIAASKDHWSELQQPSSVVEDSSGEEKEKVHLTNTAIVLGLQKQFPQTGDFFRDGDDSLLGQKIAEGGQAEIFEERREGSSYGKYVLKVFKEGSSVLDLQKQWPLGMLNKCADAYTSSGLCSPVLCGMVVMNGRFAFQMLRCAGDLRKLIDKRMERNSNQLCAPFSDEELVCNMLHIAEGMKALHQDNIVHRDLKASNVLIWPVEKEHRFEDLDSLSPGSYGCLVADYECSVGVVGTGFWRAPEILQGVKDRKITPNLFTKEADVYSFAMTCYEMITGKLPFEDLERTTYDVVLQGERPTLPKETKPWIKTLLSRCWHSNPNERDRKSVV